MMSVLVLLVGKRNFHDSARGRPGYEAMGCQLLKSPTESVLCNSSTAENSRSVEDLKTICVKQPGN